MNALSTAMLTVQAELSNRLDLITETIGNQVQKTSAAIDEEADRVDKLIGGIEQAVKQKLQDYSKELSKEQERVKADSEKWTANFEDLQARKIVEIHQAIKVLNSNAAII